MKPVRALIYGMHLKSAANFWKRAAIVTLVAVTAVVASAGGPQSAAKADVCSDAGGKLPFPGKGADVVISTECHVQSGIWNYGNVNVINGGKLIFDETPNTMNLRTEFWTKGILIEYGGIVSAGSSTQPFGATGATLTIHLYGKDQGLEGKGIRCQSNGGATSPPCGIPAEVWVKACPTQSPPVVCPSTVLPGPNPDPANHPNWPTYSDSLYQYDQPPFDDGDPNAYFGYKVLGVSEGGTLQLFGIKGAYYPPTATSPADLDPQDSGTSWVRLGADLLKGKNQLTVDATTLKTPLNWVIGDHIVVTSTDYIPSHSEELEITGITPGGTPTAPIVTITFNACSFKPPGDCTGATQWAHSGTAFPLSVPARLNLHTLLSKLFPDGQPKTKAETRAAVGLLTRSIRIASEGDEFGECFPPLLALTPADKAKGCTQHDLRPNYYFGGHTIVRQGFALFQVQGVEFKQLGEGGRLGHYPVHFHMDRTAAPNTFIKDSSINESMTRWITVHGTSQVRVERNVGYLSIGHGFYLEDAVETNNKFYSNLGVFARAGVANDQNPRSVPGILASPDEYPPSLPPPAVPHPDLSVRYESDKNNPAVFWMTHGWNDFQGNMAAGAGMCGVCFWQVPAAICGASLNETWASYASEQSNTPQDDRTGTSPLMNFDGNSCSSAMTSYQSVGYTESCPGATGDGKIVTPIVNVYAPNSKAVPPACGPGKRPWPICASEYYPAIGPGQLQQGTKCPATGPCDATNAPKCQNSNETNCVPSVINNYTSSFNWAQYNFSAIWLRSRWHLFSNSFVSDVQNAGLTFISGGDYTNSSAIKGLWEVALQNVFVGQTQGDKGPTQAGNGFASVLSPFNSTSKLNCDNTDVGAKCVSKNNSIAMGGFAAFGVSQHMFNIYDGPADEDSNAFLSIQKVDLGKQPLTGTQTVYRNVLGTALAQKADPLSLQIAPGTCYMQNAAIAWKQPNGFYYPPTFHSENLFFNMVNTRHYVIVPQFTGDTYVTNDTEAKARYCFSNDTKGNNAMFNGFSAIDRQTVLSDDDGSLTGFPKTVSVNEDPFFKAPVDGAECQSDASVKEGGTARTSPYQYVTTVVYPDCAKSLNSTNNQLACLTTPAGKGGWMDDWKANCSNELCYGVPLYRLYQTKSEQGTTPPFIRMAGSAIFQRQTMSVNHGIYYVDTTVPSAKQSASPWIFNNVFKGGFTYDFFHVYATPQTVQTLEMYVGPGLNTATDVKSIRVDPTSSPFVISPGVGGDANSLQVSYDGNILKVTLDHSAYAADYLQAKKNACVPQTFCQWTGSSCEGRPNDAMVPGLGAFNSLTQAERDKTCSYAGKDVDCANGGCIGFSVKLPSDFVASDQSTTMGIPKAKAQCYPNAAPWNLVPIRVGNGLAEECSSAANAPLTADFCSP